MRPRSLRRRQQRARARQSCGEFYGGGGESGCRAVLARMRGVGVTRLGPSELSESTSGSLSLPPPSPRPRPRPFFPRSGDLAVFVFSGPSL